MFDRIAASIDRLEPDAVARDDGDVERAVQIARAASQPVVAAEYRAPFLAHTTMEPPSAVALREPQRLTLWIGHQAPTLLRDLAAKQSGLEPEQVDVRVELLGGGFGRRAEVDFGLQAAAIAEASPGTPIKLTWTREEDIQHDLYRPAAVARCQGVTGPDGLPRVLGMDIASPSVMRSFAARVGLPAVGPDKLITDVAARQPYAIPHYRVAGYRPESLVPLGNWRSVCASFNGFFHECFLDELAVAGSQDPLAMRLALTRDFPFAQAVLRAVGEPGTPPSKPALATPSTRLPGDASASIHSTSMFGLLEASRRRPVTGRRGLKSTGMRCPAGPFDHLNCPNLSDVLRHHLRRIAGPGLPAKSVGAAGHAEVRKTGRPVPT